MRRCAKWEPDPEVRGRLLADADLARSMRPTPKRSNLAVAQGTQRCASDPASSEEPPELVAWDPRSSAGACRGERYSRSADHDA